LHSIPLKESALSANSLLQDLTPTPGGVTIPLESDTCPSIGSFPNALDDQIEGGGVIISGQPSEDVSHETPPLTNPIEKG
jgi:hypothetical protein